MAENGNAAAQPQQPAQAPQVKVQIMAQYVRDLSFENILATKPQPAATNVQPDIQVQVSLDARKREGAEHQFEVTTKFKIHSRNKADQSSLFMLEVDYAGVFHIENVPNEQMHPFLLIECPRMIFPFVRRIVSDVTRDGGFPPLNLDIVDFLALYRQELARQAELRKQAGSEGTPTPQPS